MRVHPDHAIVCSIIERTISVACIKMVSQLLAVARRIAMGGGQKVHFILLDVHDKIM